MSQSCIQFPKTMVLKLWSLHPPNHITLEPVRNANSHMTPKDLPNEKEILEPMSGGPCFHKPAADSDTKVYKPVPSSI